jgi:hypothetical protein
VSKAWLGVAFAVTSVALALTLSACGGIIRDPFPTKTVTATAAPSTTPTVSQQDAVRAWHNAVLVPLQEMRDAADEIVNAAQDFNLASMGIHCQEQKDAVEQVQQHMPSPDPDLTAQLQKALSDYSAAGAICTTGSRTATSMTLHRGPHFSTRGTPIGTTPQRSWTATSGNRRTRQHRKALRLRALPRQP